MKLFVHERLDPPDDLWIVVRSYEEAIKEFLKFQFDEISLNHLENGKIYDLVLYIKNQAEKKNIHPI